jgi:hypothetical protein
LSFLELGPLQGDLEEESDEEGDGQHRGAEGDGQALAGNVSVRREVTYSHFVSVMWDRITSEINSTGTW